MPFFQRSNNVPSFRFPTIGRNPMSPHLMLEVTRPCEAGEGPGQESCTRACRLPIASYYITAFKPAVCPPSKP